MTPNPDPLEALRRAKGETRRLALEALYRHFNHARYRAGDPVHLLWRYDDPLDRETAAWFAAGLAFGRVAQINRNLGDLTLRWQDAPAAMVRDASPREIRQALKGFQHRWTRGEHVAALLTALKALRAEGISCEAVLAEHQRPGPGGLRFAMAALVRALRLRAEGDIGHLLPDPAGTSACKRSAMFLRWMVRQDAVDPGGWTSLSPAGLWVPLDTHMHRTALALGLTRRRAADAEAAARITRAFARICPSDPVRYDFALTRLGILPAAAQNDWMRVGSVLDSRS